MLAQQEIENLQKKIASGELPADEPIFVLRARDALAAQMVEQWVGLAMMAGCPKEKTEEARQHLERMKAWPVRQMPGLPSTRRVIMGEPFVWQPARQEGKTAALRIAAMRREEKTLRITAGVSDMMKIIDDPAATEDEKRAAASTIVEAVAPEILEAANRWNSLSKQRTESGSSLWEGEVLGMPRMQVCPICGNKRCPRAESLDNPCLATNDPACVSLWRKQCEHLIRAGWTHSVLVGGEQWWEARAEVRAKWPDNVQIENQRREGWSTSEAYGLQLVIDAGWKMGM